MDGADAYVYDEEDEQDAVPNGQQLMELDGKTVRSSSGGRN